MKEGFMRHVFSVWLLFLAVSGSTFAAVDPELLGLVPPGARMVASVDVTHAKNSPFGEYLLNRMKTQDHSLEELTEQTGFDARRDLQDFVFATPGPDSAASRSKFVLLVHGNFDQNLIRAAAKSKGAAIQSYQGAELFINKSDHPGTAFAFSGGGVLIMGDIATVEQILANRGTTTPLDAGLQHLISTVGTNNDAWFASVMPGSFLANHIKEQANQPAAGQALNSITQSSGGIQLGEMVRLSFDATARSAKDAESLADVIRFVGSLVQMNRQKGPNAEIFAAAVDGMDLRTDGDAVHLSIALPATTLEQLADAAINPGAGLRVRPTTR